MAPVSKPQSELANLANGVLISLITRGQVPSPPPLDVTLTSRCAKPSSETKASEATAIVETAGGGGAETEGQGEQRKGGEKVRKERGKRMRERKGRKRGGTHASVPRLLNSSPS